MSTSITWFVKPFHDLSVTDLYNCLQLRTLVFVVEQNCVFQDMDGKDATALHLLAYDETKTVACARLFKAGDYYDLSSIGRVVVHPEYRKLNLGRALMTNAIAAIKLHYNDLDIKIGAQLYLKKFYESFGFVASSAVYLEDDIEHIEMIKTSTAKL